MASRIAERGASLTRLLDLSDTGSGDVQQPDLPGASGGSDSDGSFPLVDQRWEAFCCAIASGTVEWRAYMDHVSSRCSRPTASQQASRGVRRPEVRARVSWLIRRRNQARSAAVAGGRVDDVPGQTMSKAAKIREVEGLLRDTSLSPADRLRAIEQHNRMTVDDSQGKKPGIHDIDPADLAEYLRLAQEQGIDVAGMASGGGKKTESGEDPAERFGGVKEPREVPDPQPVGVA